MADDRRNSSEAADGRPPMDGEPGDRLDGWKAIAGHLGRDIRTVQRWEHHEGLPVHRLEHQQRASAYAFKAELDEWVGRREAHGVAGGEAGTVAPPSEFPSRAFPLRRALLVALVVAGLVVMTLAVRTIAPRREGPAGDTKDPEAYAAFANGSALYESRQYRDAAIALERAASIDPSYGLAWAFLGKTYGRLSQPMWAGGKAAAGRAADAAARAARLAPSSPETHVALALVARSDGDVTRWRAEATRALELDPRTAEALALLGDSYSSYVYACHPDQDPERADSYYRRAIALKPNQTTITDNRAHNLRRMGRYAECIALLNRAITAFRDETPLVAERGACRLLAGDLAGATEDILPLRGNPKIAPAGSLVYLGMLELKTGRAEDGIRDLEAVLQLDQTPRAELIVAETYGLADHVEQASAHLKRAFNLDPSCAAMVASSVSFKPIRDESSVKTLLAKYGVR